MKKDETLQILLFLIRDEMSISQISSILSLPYSKIYDYVNCLKEKGFDVRCKYYSNGNTKFYLNKALYNEQIPKIITTNGENVVRFLVYSDLHLGSYYESYDILKKIFAYGERKDIHLHLNLGDLVEGNVRQDNIRIPWHEQIEQALKKYPHDDEVIVFLLLGNHDQSLLRDYGFNIETVINKKRGDIVPIGYGSNTIEIKNDYIVLQHCLLRQSETPMGSYNYSLILRGHQHMSKVVLDASNLVIYLPSLSRLNFNKSHFPGALDLKLRMRCGFIEYVDFDELTYINDEFYITSSTSIYMGKGKLFRDSTLLKNEEDCPKILRRKNEKYL